MSLRAGVKWEYWGKDDQNDEVGWKQLSFGSEEEQKEARGVILKKRKGAIEIREIAGHSSRWIRAFRRTSDAAVKADEFSIRINSDLCDRIDLPRDAAVADAADPKAHFPVVEGMANTTPLVLENVFFPLGRQPRQFDTLYLGSKEVFSKPKATVQLHFEMADPRFAAIASLRSGSSGNQVLAGVAADGQLHLLQFDPATGVLSRYEKRDPQRPPSPDSTGAGVPGPAVSLGPYPAFRPAMWEANLGPGFFVAVSAKDTVWLWHEDIALASSSGWRSLGPVPAKPGSTAPICGARASRRRRCRLAVCTAR